MTFTPGLLNHGAAASHPPALRGRDPSSPEPGDTRPMYLEVLSPGGGAAPPHGSRVGASTRYHSVGLLLLLSLQPRADFGVSSTRGRLGFPAGDWGILGPLGRAASQPSRDGMKEGRRSILAPLLLLLSVIIAINIITMYFFKRNGMSHVAWGGGDVGSGQETGRASVLCSDVRNTGLTVTSFSPGCSAGPE